MCTLCRLVYMSDEPRLTPQTIEVLGHFTSGARREFTGFEIAALTELKTGTLYPILHRLENAGWLSSRWESGEPEKLGRPRRRYYKITAQGVRSANAIAQSLAPHNGRLAWT